MGDISDLADVQRFTRSREGERVLRKFRDGLVGKRIAEVEYTHHAAGVGVTLILEDGDYLDLNEVQAAYAVETLRERYKRVLEREYYVDFPERKSGHPAAAPRPQTGAAPENSRRVRPVCGDREGIVRDPVAEDVA